MTLTLQDRKIAEFIRTRCIDLGHTGRGYPCEECIGQMISDQRERDAVVADIESNNADVKSSEPQTWWACAKTIASMIRSGSHPAVGKEGKE